MKEPIVIVGIGNMGGVFAQAFLKIGHPVYPVTPASDSTAVAQALPNPLIVLVAITEDDLHAVLETIPDVWRNRIGLLQNEILPRDWESHDLHEPTVIVVWFEKRRTTAPAPYFPTLAFGPQAAVVVDGLKAIGIPAEEIDSRQRLVYELVRKNLWVITLQVVGLITEGTIGEVWENHKELCTEIAKDVLDVQEALVGTEVPRERLLDQLAHDFEEQPSKSTSGRSALGRLQRTIAWADKFGLSVATLRKISTTAEAS